MKFKAAIFDLDNTLIDSHKEHTKFFIGVLSRYGVSATAAEIAPKFGKGAAEIIEEIFQEKGITGFSKEEIEKIAEEKGEEYRKHGTVRLLPGAKQIIRKLNEKGVPLAIASSTSRANLEMALEGTGIRPYIRATVAFEDISRAKPDPEIFLKAAERLGVEPSECAVFEDSIFGVRAAVSAGMRCIGVATGEWPLETLEKEGCMAFRSLVDVIPKLDDMFG